MNAIDEAYKKASNPEAEAGETIESAVPEEVVIKADFTEGDGTRLLGDFVFALPSANDLIMIARMEAALCGGVDRASMAVDHMMMIRAISNLKVCMRSAPKDFAGWETVRTPQIIMSVFEEVLKHRDRFHGQLRGGAQSQA